MSNPYLTLLFAVALPFFVAPWTGLLSGYLGGKTGLVLSLVPAVMLSLLFIGGPGDQIPIWSVPWIEALGVHLTFRLDGLGALMALVVTVIGTLVFIYAGTYLSSDERLGRFWAILLLFLGAMTGTVLSDNAVTLFVFWELTSVCSYLLIGYNHHEKKSRQAALQALLVTGLGGILMLVGFLMLGRLFGSLSLTIWATSSREILSSPTATVALVFVLLGAVTKSAQFPFHFWLPGAMAAPTPISTYLHSATMVKLGVFLLARLHPITQHLMWWNTTLIVLGSATLVTGAYAALSRTDMKVILAHTTVSMLGGMVMLIGVGGEYGATAAILVLIAHALYKGALFMVCGSIDHATGTRDLPQLWGLRSALPWTSTAAIFAALSMAGVVPTVGFLAKEYWYKSLLAGSNHYHALALGCALLGNVASVAIAWWVGVKPFLGDTRSHPNAHESPASLWLPAVTLSLAGLILGTYPGFLQPMIDQSVQAMGYDRAVSIKLWTGIHTPLVLSVATLSLGVAIAFFPAAIRKRMTFPNALSSITPTHVYERSLALLLRFGAWQIRRLQHGSLGGYLALIILVASLLIVLAYATLDTSLPVLVGTLPLHDMVIGALVVCAAIAATVTDSRIAALAELGIIGLGLSLVFVLYGAPDLALTMLLVETLGLIVFILVLTVLPANTRVCEPCVRRRDALVGLAAGLAITVLVLHSQRSSPPLGLREYFGEKSLLEAFGRNVVNVILVDFRALDTLGEITVLAIAALGIAALLRRGKA